MEEVSFIWYLNHSDLPNRDKFRLFRFLYAKNLSLNSLFLLFTSTPVANERTKAFLELKNTAFRLLNENTAHYKKEFLTSESCFLYVFMV